MLRTLTLCAILSATCCQRLVFNENFDYLNVFRWNHLVTADRGGDQEFQYYRNSRNNSYVKNGILYIKPTLTADEYGEDYLYNGHLDLTRETCNKVSCSAKAGDEIVPPIQSAHIRTINTFRFKYGRVEVRAKMPRGDWLWPAIWLEPSFNEYGAFPTSGAIKIAESRGNRKLYDVRGSRGSDTISSSLHFGPSPDKDGRNKAYFEKRLYNGDFADDFHVYAVEWNENQIRFLVDNEQVGIVQPPRIGGFYRYGGFLGINPWIRGTPMAPFDKDFHVVVNLGVGGTSNFPESFSSSPRGKPWNDASRHPMREFWERRHWWYPSWNPYTEDTALQVDYIRVWQY